MALQTLISERVELRFPKIMGRMGQCGNAAGSLDQGNRLAAIEPRLLHAGRASIAKISGEDLACTGHLARSRQVIGQMAPAQAGAGKARRTASRSIEAQAFAVVRPSPRFARLDRREAMPLPAGAPDRRRE